MAIRIVKPPPPPREHLTSCDHCKAELAFTKEDCVAVADYRDPAVAIECPCCHKQNFLSLEVFK